MDKKNVSDFFAGQKDAAGLQLLKVNRKGLVKLSNQAQLKAFFNIEDNIPSIEGFLAHKSMMNKSMVFEQKEDGGIGLYLTTQGAGIYMIYCLGNKKTYIGRSNNVRGRLNTHSYFLKKGTHHNQYLQNAFNKYGSESFVAVQIESSEDAVKLGKRELFWANTYNVFKNGFNIAPISDNPAVKTAYGMKLSGENNGNSRLTSEQVQEICSLFNEKKYSITEISEMFKMAERTISAIRKGFRWKTVTVNYLSDEIKQLYWI